MTRYYEYIEKIQSGEIPAGKTIKQAIERQIEDLNKKDFPYYLDEAEAQKVIDFVELTYLRDGETPFILEPWQVFLIACLYGWKQKKDGYRRYRQAYIQIAKKNGKTQLGTALMLYDLMTEKTAEVYSIATSQEIASRSFNDAKKIVEASPDFSKLITTHYSSLVYGNSVLKSLSADKDKNGLGASFLLVDEYAFHKSNMLYESLTSGMRHRKQPLTVIITTASFDTSSYCFSEYERCKSILNKTINDERTFVLIYELDEEDEEENPENWIKSNPSIGSVLELSNLELEYNKAVLQPHLMNSFRVFSLNKWTNQFSRWLNYEKWKNENCDPVNEKELINKICYGGLDLSTSIDLSALVLDFPPEEEGGKHRKIYKFFMPEEAIQERELQDKVPYSLWVEQGYIIATTGNVIDYNVIEKTILDLATKYNIQEIAFDPYNSTQLVQNLLEKNINMVEHRQGFVSMNTPSREYERLILQGAFSTGNNPVMNWMVSNVEIQEDSSGNIKPVKPKRDKTGKRIDGVVADIMATGRAITNKNKTSVYEDRGILSI